MYIFLYILELVSLSFSEIGNLLILNMVEFDFLSFHGCCTFHKKECVASISNVKFLNVDLFPGSGIAGSSISFGGSTGCGVGARTANCC